MNYKRIRIFRSIMGVVFILAFLVIGIEFGTANDTGLMFSEESGFYDDSFYLEISNSGDGTIYYTLDSSDPDENSILYTGPILITDASANANKYSMLKNTSIAFDEYVSSVAVIHDWALGRAHDWVESPEALIDKATVIRAVSVGADGGRSESVTKVYFVGFDKKIGYDGMNIMAITTDPKLLFDDFEGIYVTGKVYDDYLAGLDSFVDFDYTWTPANYRIKTRVEADVKFWGPDFKLMEEANVNIAVQGGGSRAWLPKNLNLYNDDPFTPVLLHSDVNARTLNLFAGSQDLVLKIKDYLVHSFCDGFAVSVKKMVPSVLFLNGEYWGTYYLSERYDEDYFESKYMVQSDDVIYLKNREVDIGITGDGDYYTELCNYVADNDISKSSNFSLVQDMIDIESCIDYYALNIYIGNMDWPVTNTTLWRTRKVNGDSMYSDGRWRWCIHDINYSMFCENAQEDLIQRCVEMDSFFAKLMENPQFNSKLKQRLLYLARHTFSPDRVNAWVDDYVLKMENSMQNDYERFYNGKKTIEDFYAGCEDIKNYFQLRNEYVIQTYGAWDERKVQT